MAFYFVFILSFKIFSLIFNPFAFVFASILMQFAVASVKDDYLGVIGRAA